MKKPERLWELIWFNYIANETTTNLIKANTKKEALETAELYIKSEMGKDYFPSAIERLHEYSMDDILTKEDMVEKYKNRYNEEPEYTDYIKAYLYDIEDEAEDKEIERMIQEAFRDEKSTDK